MEKKKKRGRKKNAKSVPDVDSSTFLAVVVEESVSVEEEVELRNSIDRDFVKLTIEQKEWDCGRSETANNDEEGKSVESVKKDSVDGNDKESFEDERVKKDSIIAGDGAGVTRSDAIIPTDQPVKANQFKSVQTEKKKKKRRSKKNAKSVPDVDSSTFSAVVVEESVSLDEEVELRNSIDRDFVKLTIEQIEWDCARSETADNVEEGKSVESVKKVSVDGNDRESFEYERENDEGEVGKSGHAMANVGGYNQNINQRRIHYSMKPDAEDCTFYMKFRSCKFGSQSKFNHLSQRRNQFYSQGVKEKANYREESSERGGQIECKYYGTTGGHKYGKGCKHSHGSGKSSTSRSPKFNFMGLPIRPGEKECPYYMRTGSCKHGSNCRLHHPEPTSVIGAYSSGHDSGGTLPPQFGSSSPASPWSSPRAFNESSPFLPKMFTSFQDTPSSNPEWKGYQAAKHSPSSGKTLPIPPAVAMNNILATGIQFPPQYQNGTVAEEYPEHPGEPGCSLFMKTQDCKFKSNCKLHHPRNRISKPKENSYSFNDKDLPLRHDQPVCTYHHSNGFIKGETDFVEKIKHRRKSRRRKICIPEVNDVHGDPDSSRKSADHVYPSRNDQLHDEQVGCCSSEVRKSPFAGNCEDRATTTQNDGKDDFIATYFNSNVACSGVNETCRKYVQCHSLFVEGSECNEREVAMLLSSEQKLYIVAVDACDGSETGFKMVGSHRVGDVKQVFVGLGLQVVRICFEGDASYLLITRCMGRSSELLGLLSFFDSSAMKNTCPLTSLEQIQLNCFVEHVCGGSHINLFQYSMVLFCPQNLGEKLWLPRSLFVLKGHLLLCTEKLVQFGPSVNAFSPQYLSLDSCCTIIDVSKMVINTQDSPCITLTLKGTTKFHPSEKVTMNQDGAFLNKKSASDDTVWKLKWFSTNSLFNFIALMKAIHPEGLLITSSS